jgi:outer membrane protein OmpA-like peptidoglycan-associated protein
MRRIRERCSYSKTIGLLIILVCHGFTVPLFSQNSIADSSRIKVTPLSKINTKEAEYSPFKFKDKFYFVSDRENDFAVIYYDQTTNHQFSDLYRATQKDTLKFKKIISISAKIKTKFYIGPTCETNDGFYCTVNNSELVKSKKRLPLQINYLAKDAKNKLLNPVRINFGLNDTVSCAQPSVWHDTLMFFASDLFVTGKIDLFYSVKKNNVWGTPVSCGNKVNTEYNELFPYFVNNTLYFASDRPNGYGGLDIYSINIFEENPEVKLLSVPVNSKADDFGVYIDSAQRSGYFSSNRSGNDDIFYFRSIIPDYDNCKEVESNNYCFTFFEEASLDTKDTTGMDYEWNFGDGGKLRGLEVKHCYATPGKFLVELNVVDKTTGAVFFNEVNYEFELKNLVQIYIHAPDTAKTNTEVPFDPAYTNLDSLQISSYFWDFGDGQYSFEEKPKHVYTKEGTYYLKLGLEGKKAGKKIKDCATKRIIISDKADKPVYNFNPPIKVEPPIDYQKRLLDTMAKNEKELYAFVMKKLKEDSLSASKIASTVTQGNEEKVGMLPKVDKDDLKNVYVFNEKDSTVTYKVHIGVSPDKLDKNDPAFKGLDNISYILLDSLYHYFYGATKTLDSIMPYYKRSKDEGFNASVISSFIKEELKKNPSFRYQFLMLKDTIRKGYVRPGKDGIIPTNTIVPTTTVTTDTIVPTTTVTTDTTVPTTTVVVTNTSVPTKTTTVVTNTSAPTKTSTVVTSTSVPTKTKTVVTNTVTKDPKNNDPPQVTDDIRITYRVQVGAYRTPKPLSSFAALNGTVREVITDDGWYKYVTDNVVTLENAMDLQTALESMGYSNAFITAYKGKRRVTIVESVFDGLCVYFDFDKSVIRPNEQEKIDFYFKNYTNKTIKSVELEGNTCNLGTAEYNFKLSERRVLAVEQALNPYVKVKINRKFLGEFYPLYSNSGEANRRLNRRVDVLILN